MCFSATASFSAGVALLGVGALALQSVRTPRKWPLAAIPPLFALQQLSEGVIWLAFTHESPRLNAAMTEFYSFFSHALWPAYIPLAVLPLEPVGSRRRLLGGFVVTGFMAGGYLLIMLFMFPIVSRPTGQHVEYVPGGRQGQRPGTMTASWRRTNHTVKSGSTSHCASGTRPIPVPGSRGIAGR